MIEGSLTCYKLPLFSCTVTQATHAVKHRLSYSELTVSAKGDDLAIQVKNYETSARESTTDGYYG